jgi:hypothetical protein
MTKPKEKIMERKYYLVKPDGKSMKAIKEWQRLSHEASEKANAITKELGAKPEILRNSENILGLIFDHDPGRIWKPVKQYGEKGKNCYYPDKRIKEGRALAKRLNAIRLPGTHTFANLIGGGFFIVTDSRHWASISFHSIGENYIISVPIAEKKEDAFIPPDTTLLKLSEYYAMKEAAEEIKEGKEANVAGT